jgi:hypothetical protein
MATTNKGFFFVAATGADGGGCTKAIDYTAIDGYSGADPNATRIDYALIDSSRAAYQKNGCGRMMFSGATIAYIDLTDMEATLDTCEGDMAFSSWKLIQFVNDGGSTIKIEPDSTDPATVDFTRIDVRDGKRVILHSSTGTTIDATHCRLKLTSTTDGAIWIVVGGS